MLPVFVESPGCVFGLSFGRLCSRCGSRCGQRAVGQLGSKCNNSNTKPTMSSQPHRCILHPEPQCQCRGDSPHEAHALSHPPPACPTLCQGSLPCFCTAACVHPTTQPTRRRMNQGLMTASTMRCYDK
eukprot:6157278-Amphidinium_carterae.1